MYKITFIGLGNIGYHIASHLSSRKEFKVTVYNRTKSKTKKWLKEYNGKTANTIQDAVYDSDILILCVGDDNDVNNVLFSEKGAFDSLKSGSIIIDHTTTSAQIARVISEKAKKRNIGFIDAPVSGGRIGAEKGSLSIMVGGDKQDYDKALSIMKYYGKTINLMGKAGAGQLTKMANQILISNTLQGVAEAIKFSYNAGLDLENIISILSKGAAQSWQLNNRGHWMFNSKYKEGGFTVDLIEKDLSLVAEEAILNKSNIPQTTIVKGFFTELQNQGKGGWDFSSLYELL